MTDEQRRQRTAEAIEAMFRERHQVWCDACNKRLLKLLAEHDAARDARAEWRAARAVGDSRQRVGDVPHPRMESVREPGNAVPELGIFEGESGGFHC